MIQVVKRGYNPKDEIEFGKPWGEKMNRAGKELYFLLNHGYHISPASTFIGNHYMFSERQRMAIARMVSTNMQLQTRKSKELEPLALTKKVHIDGFNTIITLEVALSESLLIRGMDGTIRDLAGLRGTYRIIDKTKQAIELILQALDELYIKEATFYLDQPVSNSGRLKGLIYETAANFNVSVDIEVINNVDRVLEEQESVITSDAIILDNCLSWFNLNKWIMEKYINHPWIFQIYNL